MKPKSSVYVTGSTEYHQEWRKANPERVRAAKARYRKSHPDQKRADDRRHYAKNTAKKKAKVAAYRKAHPEKLRAKDHAYAKARPDVILAKSARKHARKRYAPGRGVSTTQWNELFAASAGLCVYCGKRAPLQLDHIDPLSKGGAHDIDNAAAACAPCNSSKNDTLLLLWLATRRARAA